ncbi:alkaline phosphatase PhoX [Aquabacterium sp. G14]|uniref:alkaline phosphatase PhoX n=1 Tax=Aquabacterium sp. G14 TaxID=3130164 RepID=UPI0030A041B3
MNPSDDTVAMDEPEHSRREHLRQLFWTTASACAVPWLLPATARAKTSPSPFSHFGPLQAPNAHGLCLPAGFTARVVAVSGERPVATMPYVWHTFPDGGATFATRDGGWVYANNSEVASGRGGVGALRFDARGRVVQAYPILSGTTLNCAGGPTPWGTWLSAEEFPQGRVWECQPLGRPEDAVVRPALGCFKHEAVAVDPVHKMLYLTEDEPDGRLYRFVCAPRDWPSGARRPTLRDGTLQVLQVEGLAASEGPDGRLDVAKAQRVRWVDVVQPASPQAAVRSQLGTRAPGTPFKGGEGLWYFQGLVYFSTKTDNRIWVYDTQAYTLQTLYDFALTGPEDQVLSGVDNLTVSQAGDVLVAEDGGNMELCVISPDRRVRVLLRVLGQDGSEITGPAFSPDGQRLYFNSQRGGRTGPGLGITYEVSRVT